MSDVETKLDRRVETWINQKMENTISVICVFMKYLLKERDGFLKVEIEEINRGIVSYVIEEMMDCSISKYKRAETVPEKFEEDVLKIVRRNSKFSISKDAIEYLYLYTQSVKEESLKGLDVSKIVERKKNIYRNNLIKLKKEKIREFKTDDSIIKIVELYSALIVKIKNSKEVCEKTRGEYISSLDYRYNPDLRFTEEEKNLLLEMKVKEKYIDRVNKYYDWGEEQLRDSDNKKYKLTKETKEQFNNNMIDLMGRYIRAFEEILEKVEKNKIVKRLAGIDYSQWGESYKTISTIQERRDFIKEIEKGILDSISKIDTLKIVEEVEDELLDIFEKRLVLYSDYLLSREELNTKSIDEVYLLSLSNIIMYLTDWLEIDLVGKDEILSSLKIIVPVELWGKIEKEQKEFVYTKNVKEFMRKISSLDLKISSKDTSFLNCIESTLENLKKMDVSSDEYKKLLTRLQFFSLSQV